MAKTVTVGSVNIDMSVNANKLIIQVKKAEQTYNKSLQKMIKQSQALAKKTASATKSIAKFAAVSKTLGAVALGIFTVKTYEAQREMQRLSDQAGISLAQFTQMSHVTNALGLQTEYLADGMKDLNARIIDAAKGGGTMVNFFTRIGQEAKTWADLKPAEQIDRFTAELNKMTTNEASFWADEINDSMFRLSTTLSRSGKSLQEFQDRAKELGAGTSAQFIGQINGMYESFYELKILWDEISRSTLGILATTFQKTFGTLVTQAEAALKKLGGGNLSQGILVAAKTFASVVLGAISQVAQGIQSLLNSLPSSITGKGVGDADTSKQDQQLTHEVLKRRDLEVQIKDAKRAAFKGEEGAVKRQQALNTLLEISRSKTNDLNKERTDIIKSHEEFNFADVITKYSVEAQKSLEGLSVKLEDISKKTGTTVVIDEGKLSTEAEKIKGILDGFNTGEEDPLLKRLTLQMNTIKAFIAEATKLKDSLKDANTPQLDAQLATAMAASDAVAKAINDQQAVLEDKRYQESIAAFMKYSTDRRAVAHEVMLAEQAELDTSFSDGLIDYEVYWLAKNEIDKKYAQASTQIQVDEQNKVLQSQQVSLGLLAEAGALVTSVIGQTNEESSNAQKLAFLAIQGVAVAQAIVNANLAWSQATVDPTVPNYAAKLAQAETARALGYATAGVIAGTSIAGVFDDGTPMGGVPRDGTYMLEKGEMVMSKDNSKKFGDDMSMGGGGGITINAPMNVSGNVTDQKWFQQELVKNRNTILNSVNKANKERPQNKKR
ncbi:MAG: hypothetical protein COA84_14050 [Robiginitomaculum sp.]|nr:MAG: hypothetical protein COA84_14050 [Robiginitomaculum sp.]